MGTSGDPPVFLRFINLLTNDATFLLDEALQVRAVVSSPQRLFNLPSKTCS